MKICVITPLFEPLNVGGAEKYINNLAKEIAKNHKVVVITTAGPTPRKHGEIEPNLKIIEITPFNVYSLYSGIQNVSSNTLPKKILWHLFLLWNFSSFIQIKKILRREKPDIVHTNGIQGLSPSVFSAIKQSTIPHVHTIHDYQLVSPWISLYRNGKPFSTFNVAERFYIECMKNISAGIDAVISPSQFAMDLHKKLGFFRNSKQYVVPHGIKMASETVPKQNMTGEFLYIGRITEDKGPQVVINAVKKIKDKNIRLHIIGDGPYLNFVKQLAKEDNRIIIHGFVQNDDLIQIFEKCSFAILPSLWYEVFGYTILETMNKGLPVISTDIGAIPEIVKNGHNGFLVEPRNVDALYLAIKNLLNTRNIHELSKNAIESSRRFTVEDQINKTQNIYSDLLLENR